MADKEKDKRDINPQPTADPKRVHQDNPVPQDDFETGRKPQGPLTPTPTPPAHPGGRTPSA